MNKQQNRLWFLMALMLMISSSALAQGGNTSRSKAARRTPRVADAVIISGNRLTLRPGYQVASRSGNTVVVTKQGGLRKSKLPGTTVTATCACVERKKNNWVEGTGNCKTSDIQGSSIIDCGAEGSTCQRPSTCQWINSKVISKGTTGIQ